MPRQPQESRPEATLKRGNESVVAGLHCVDWSWTEDVETRTVCITADGVLLRFLVDGQIVSEARSVGYRPQPAELFQVPPGYAPCWPRKAARALIDEARGEHCDNLHGDGGTAAHNRVENAVRTRPRPRPPPRLVLQSPAPQNRGAIPLRRDWRSRENRRCQKHT